MNLGGIYSVHNTHIFFFCTVRQFSFLTWRSFNVFSNQTSRRLKYCILTFFIPYIQQRTKGLWWTYGSSTNSISQKKYAGSSLPLFLLLIAFISLCFHLKFMLFSYACSSHHILNWLRYKLCSSCYFYDTCLLIAIWSLFSFLSSPSVLVLSQLIYLLHLLSLFFTEVTFICKVQSMCYLKAPAASWNVFSKSSVWLSKMQVFPPLLPSLCLWDPFTFFP